MYLFFWLNIKHFNKSLFSNEELITQSTNNLHTSAQFNPKPEAVFYCPLLAILCTATIPDVAPFYFHFSTFLNEDTSRLNT